MDGRGSFFGRGEDGIMLGVFIHSGGLKGGAEESEPCSISVGILDECGPDDNPYVLLGAIEK